MVSYDGHWKVIVKAVILAGGLGSRLGEETVSKPKPLVEIGGRPIIWHIMKTYSLYGVNDFVICLGYKGDMIKEFFANYYLHTSDVTFDISANKMHIHRNTSEPWRVTLVDTGADSMTGGRLKRIKPYVEDEQAFCMTYGDGVSDVDIGALMQFHDNHGGLATLTGVRPPGRFGALTLDGERVHHFEEKPVGDGAWINGGYFVLSPQVLDLIEGDATIWEQEPMRALAAKGELHAFLHDGFWQCMDTLRDKNYLDALVENRKAPWWCSLISTAQPGPSARRSRHDSVDLLPKRLERSVQRTPHDTVIHRGIVVQQQISEVDNVGCPRDSQDDLWMGSANLS